MGDERDTIARLERRLAREREARLAAESIAESGTRELYEQQRRLKLVETITAAANLSETPATSFQHALDKICEFTGWPLGHVYNFADGSDRSELQSAGLWHDASGGRYDGFRDRSGQQRFRPGEGLPGRAWNAGQAVWVEDVANEPDFPRKASAAACGLRAAFCFPVRVGAEVVALLEFFAERPLAPDSALLTTLDQIGLQLGRVIERHRADVALRRQNAELARLVEEAETQRRAAEAANRAKTAFLAVTSHEVRTPLNAVLGLAQVLRGHALPDEQRELVEGILDSGAMLLRLLNAVLDLSRIEAGEVSADPRDFDVRAMAEMVARVWRARGAELGVELVLDLAGLDEPCQVRADEGKVEQTLINLLSNALKFTPAGGTVVLRLAGPDVAGHIRVEVVDGGPGVPEADLARIFRPFEQTETGRQAGGAGLGLAICAGNVAALGGEIAADHDASGRSRFWFTFEAAPPEAALPPVPALASAAAAPDRRLRVLAAEDNVANRKVLQLLLAAAPIDLTCVEDGRLALEAVQAEPYDLVLMDVNMPVMDGVEAVRAIRGLGGGFTSLPIQMLTANVFEEDVRRYLEAGADGVLRKPIELPALFGALAATGASEAPVAATRAAPA